MKRVPKILLFSLFFSLTRCGSETPPSPAVTSQPVLMAALPAFAPVGTTIALQGVGFSLIPNQNIVVAGGATAVGLSHAFIPEAEQPANGAVEEITFEVPPEAQPSVSTLFVLVGNTPSNSISFTVETP